MYAYSRNLQFASFSLREGVGASFPISLYNVAWLCRDFQKRNK